MIPHIIQKYLSTIDLLGFIWELSVGVVVGMGWSLSSVPPLQKPDNRNVHTRPPTLMSRCKCWPRCRNLMPFRVWDAMEARVAGSSQPPLSAIDCREPPFMYSTMRETVASPMLLWW